MNNAEKKNERVLVFGLDGAPYELISSWLESGYLPFLQKLKKEGAYGPLEVSVPTISLLEWPVFYTGKNPAKLGLFGLGQVKDPKENTPLTLANTQLIEGPTLWELLNKGGISVGVMNIPATYPPVPVQGFLIAGMLSPSSSQFYYPKNLKSYLREYRIGIEAEQFGELPDKLIDKSGLLEELYDIHTKRVKTILTLLEAFPVDFFIVNFKELDELQHLFWDSKKTLLDFYQTVDKSMEWIVAQFRPTHTFVISDHGFHHAEREYFFVNRWLEEKGFLERTPSGKLYALVHPILSQFFKGKVRELIPARFKTREKLTSLAGGMINFHRTKAYANVWGVYLSDIIKDNEEYTKYKKLLRKELESARNPHNGEKIFKKVYAREEIYAGKYLHKFPEFITLPNPNYLPNPVLSNKLFEPRVDKPYLEGAHKSATEAILFTSGEKIKKGCHLEGVNILDLAPTILHLYGLEPTPEMDGTIIRKMLIDKQVNLQKKSTT
ncbi:MAG: hypothetical protein GWO20_13405 [Candidatus Korarchaeota archaeon]|nr:hypothetical protein [Candidatus Korarchaeota archaeon]NIU84390.1 hypothetical protein [Candidatus Thorarchaeota archaeon]NIW14498.1 hypothetical protein [Candidatus Thorarchaeota archaeon]NIW52578.1 hypothetical protein [Candidatus Korarchaeota archaeon]